MTDCPAAYALRAPWLCPPSTRNRWPEKPTAASSLCSNPFELLYNNDSSCNTALTILHDLWEPPHTFTGLRLAVQRPAIGLCRRSFWKLKHWRENTGTANDGKAVCWPV